MSRRRALVVDDEPDIRELLSITLGRMDLDVATADDWNSAVRLLGGERYDLVLTDMRLPDGFQPGLHIGGKRLETFTIAVPVARREGAARESNGAGLRR